MDENRIEAIVRDKPSVTELSNFPTPMAMAPVAQPANNSTPQIVLAQPIANSPAAEVAASPQSSEPTVGPTDAR